MSGPVWGEREGEIWLTACIFWYSALKVVCINLSLVCMRTSLSISAREKVKGHIMYLLCPDFLLVGSHKELDRGNKLSRLVLSK